MQLTCHLRVFCVTCARVTSLRGSRLFRVQLRATYGLCNGGTIHVLEYLYRESSDIEGPEIDGHVTHGAILFHKSCVEFACASKPH